MTDGPASRSRAARPALFLLLACAGTTSTAMEPPEERTPFTEAISGTAQSFEMVPVSGGSITIEGRTLEIEPFWIARTETTWDLYDIFVFGLDGSDGSGPADAVTKPSRPYVSPDRGFGHSGYAAISVAIEGARHYCQWLSAKTGRRYRLPTEAEWRHACVLAKIERERIDEHAWSEDNAEFTPHPVAQKKPDALGLYDLWGNVMEWCIGPDGKPVALGGSFRQKAAELGCQTRAVPTPEWQVTDPQVPKSSWWLSDAEFLGFRVVCEGPSVVRP